MVGQAACLCLFICRNEVLTAAIAVDLRSSRSDRCTLIAVPGASKGGVFLSRYRLIPADQPSWPGQRLELPLVGNLNNLIPQMDP